MSGPSAKLNETNSNVNQGLKNRKADEQRALAARASEAHMKNSGVARTRSHSQRNT